MSTATQSRTVTLGVGIDTARYGHHATFLQEDRQPATKPLEFLESRNGYQQLQDAFSKLAKKHENAHFHIRVDAAGQYATNLLGFLEQLPWPKTISVGEPARNKQYRQVHFPKRKADATESHACARFAVVERPDATPPTPLEMLALREVASRLEFQVKTTTRQINRLHNLLARVFPELATGSYTIAAFKEGYARDGRRTPALSSKTEPKPVTIYLGSAFGLTGRVVGHDDAPIAGATVMASPSNAQGWDIGQAPLFARTDGQEILG